jgi:alpha-tubulin suppressor-like RCC1 family protein
MQREQFQFFKDIYYNNTSISNSVKIPVINLPISTPGLLGDIIIDNISKQFCYHNGSSWQCINSGLTASGINIGGAPGQIYSSTINNTLQFRTLQSNSGIDISTIGNVVSVSNTINGSNLGTGDSVFTSRNGVNFEFKTLVAGSNISIDNNSDELTINVNTNNISEIFSNFGNVFYIDKNNDLYGYGINSQSQLGVVGPNAYLPLLLSKNGILDGNTIVKVAPGNNFTLALDSNGILYSWGANNNGQLGNGNFISSSSPTLVDMSGVLAGVTIVDVYAGFESGYALDNTGILYSWGLNIYGKLGDGTVTTTNVPVNVVMPGTTFVKVVVSDYVCYALGANGSIYAWGNGANSSLANAIPFADAPTPITLGALAGQTIVTIGACASNGDSSSGYAVDNNGVVYGWGANFYSQLGDASVINRPSPVISTGTIAGQTIVKISAHGFGSVYCIDNNGVMYSCGNNSSGQLGINNNFTQSTFATVQTFDRFKDVDGYNLSVVGLTTENAIVACGSNTNFQLAVGSQGSKFLFTPVLTEYQLTGPGNSAAININSSTVLSPLLTKLSQSFNIVTPDITITLPDLLEVVNTELTFNHRTSGVCTIVGTGLQTIVGRNFIVIGQYDSVTLLSVGGGDWIIRKSYMYPVFGFYKTNSGLLVPANSTISMNYDTPVFNGQQGNAFNIGSNRLQPTHPGSYTITYAVKGTTSVGLPIGISLRDENLSVMAQITETREPNRNVDIVVSTYFNGSNNYIDALVTAGAVAINILNDPGTYFMYARTTF